MDNTSPHRAHVPASALGFAQRRLGRRGKSEVNDVPKDDNKENAVFSASFGFTVHKSGSAKLAYWRTETQTFVGSNTHNVALAYSFRF